MVKEDNRENADKRKPNTQAGIIDSPARTACTLRNESDIVTSYLTAREWGVKNGVIVARFFFAKTIRPIAITPNKKTFAWQVFKPRKTIFAVKNHVTARIHSIRTGM
ncbi:MULTISPECIES: hypothetical protein [Symbiopectobacterium]|uniref:hypothetical protein n=1 Tax=Symbiopectobacterium TaxID=801 RepID=UPI001A1EE78E|nr:MULTISPECIES: hypothetical protein [Symbiopectobacterium]MBG6247137.1 hypothetical protein [Candidatus Symbiopectobacterium sp. PLON1]MBT9428199.1 hypothetical protein [Candidatus Symbiopectobacterium endolongispinus]